jgi:hypothetical protein
MSEDKKADMFTVDPDFITELKAPEADIPALLAKLGIEAAPGDPIVKAIQNISEVDLKNLMDVSLQQQPLPRGWP